MTVSNSLPTEAAAGLSLNDERLIRGGMVVRSAAGVPRVGVFPAHTGALVTGRATMGYDVAQLVAATSRNGSGVEIVAVTAAETVTTTAAPGSNSRIDVIWIRSRFPAFGDAGQTTPVLGVTQGTPAGSPSKPAVPAGALELATAVIPSTATTTLSAGVVITQTHPYTAATGGAVLLRNATEQAAWSPGDGGIAERLDSGQLMHRSGGVWRPIPFAEEQGQIACPASGGEVTGSHGYSQLLNVSFTPGRFTVAPKVYVTTTGPADQVVWPGMVEQVTTSGCKVRGGRVGSAPNNLFTVHWHAVQMSSGSAVG